MSSSNGTNYFQKSMNGIITLDDGGGTVIEDGIIKADTLEVENLSINELTVYNATVNHDLDVVNNIHSGFLSVDNTISGFSVSLNDQFGGFYGQTLDTNIGAGDVNLYNSTYNLSLNVGGNTDIINIGNVGTIRLGSGLSLSTLYLGNIFKIQGSSISSGMPNETIGLLSNLTGGELQLGSGLTNGICSIGRSMTSGYVQLGQCYKFSGVNVDTILDGQTYGLFNNMTTSNLRIGHSMVSGVVAIANNKTSGDINIMNNSPSSGNFNIGDNCNGAINLVRNSTTTGHVNIANTWKIWKNNFEFYNLSATFNFLNNLTSTVSMSMGGYGALNIGTITTNDIRLGFTGNVKIGNVFTFQSENITSSGTADIINLFNNITTGTINFCNGLTATGLLKIGAGMVKFGTGQIWGYTKFGVATTNFTIPSTINVNGYLFVANGSTNGQILTLPSYIDGQIIYVRNNKTTANLVIQCFGTQTLRLKNNGLATNITVGSNTSTMLIGTDTTWYYYI
jgi:hypothetical protein